MEEYEILTDSEKATAIRSKIKNIQYQRYSFELDLISENAISDPNELTVSETQKQINDLNARQAALQAELDLLA
jgi:hypothetical protein